MKKLLIAVLPLFIIVVIGSRVIVAQKPVKPDTPAKITVKPRISPQDSASCPASSGTAMVRATLDASGKVTNAVITKASGCELFDNRALAAARHVEFVPAMKGGKPVTSDKYFDYKWSRY